MRLVQRALGRVVCRYGEMVTASALREALPFLSDGSAWSAFLFDVQLPDGSGLDLLAKARATYPSRRP